jgi:hypothetical protein
MDVKNVTGGILIFIVRDRIAVTKILNVSLRLHKFFRSHTSCVPRSDFHPGRLTACILVASRRPSRKAAY